MRRHDCAIALYRALLWAYPTSFRGRFAPQMAADFADLIEERGLKRAWRTALVDLASALPAAHAHARRQRLREARLHVAKEGAVSSFFFDLRHALSTLGKAPVFTTVTILTLAVGIGANTASFSLVHAALLRPLGFPDPERLVLIYEGIPQGGFPKMPGSAPDILDLERYQRSFETVAAYRALSMELSARGEPRRLDVTRATADLFPLLGAHPMLGRTFTDTEEAAGHDVIVLGHALWQQLFAGRTDVLGAQVRLDRRPFTVVGVMPPAFEFPRRGPRFNAVPADAWVPLVFTPDEQTTRGLGFVNSVIARLAPGVTSERAQEELAGLGRRIWENYPPEIRSSPYQLELSAAPLRDEIVGEIRTPLMLLFGAVALVLMVACANVANLVLSRAVSRQRELDVRLALGAPRARLAQLLFCESLVLSLAGGALGLVLAHGVLHTVRATFTASLPGLHHVRLDVPVTLFTIALSVLTAIVFALLPLYISGHDVTPRLHEGSSRTVGSRRGRRIQGVLVTATVTLAVVLVVAAGLLVRSLQALLATGAGFGSAQALTMSVDLPREGYPTGQALIQFTRQVHERVGAIPGVIAMAVATDVPLQSNDSRGMTPERGANASVPSAVMTTWVFGDYFRALGVPVKRGRLFRSDEHDQPRSVVVVNEAVVRRYWPGRNPIGQRVKWGGKGSYAPWMTVVGVVGDVKHGSLRDEPMMHVYAPFSEKAAEVDHVPAASRSGRSLRLVLLGTDASFLATPARRAVAAIDPALPVTRVATMEQQVEEATAPQRFGTTVLTGFAVGALLLAGIGLYGVLAFAIAGRTREIGVRIALGATRTRVLRMVMGDGMRLVLAGVVLGLAGAAAASRVMQSLLYRTQPYDPWVFAAAPLVLCLVGLLACYVPARRAAGVEPVRALRAE